MVSGITQFYLTYKRIVCFSTEPKLILKAQQAALAELQNLRLQAQIL